MKGTILKSAGAAFEVVNDIEKPKPDATQILVKSIATAINPVYAYPNSLQLLQAWLDCRDDPG
jgi:NADPH:quinone reductase-like Zn-dependent oxidoreductase